MRRVLPFPRMFLALWVMWLLLNQSLSPGQIVLGAIVAWGACWAMARLDPPPAHIRAGRAMLLLAFRVAIDVIRSNIAVGKIILGFGRKDRSSGLMTVPLDLRDQYGLAVLAIILTATPGTLWLNHDPARSELLIHVLDLVEEEEWRDLIKNRYERLLMEIFQ
ncbi:Na+/H+ antiporter subunit E [Ancylobacter sp. 6x-1]|uniref:Na+/H+ antiporter subunit E n=1 Tax=Ancylobacter crimeensis TaxID=2579147 RepID=A0ABT0D621_9HYPH|nr:Na+/H+ antiporter subunit E [Ancylobacter crimeensis]MCK0195384.1 Na+/H+ antiporter subunit E [Ancylobacter crimeensis]